MAKPIYGTPPVKKLAGHKCLGAVMCFEVHCECGWHSCPHSGEGARGLAYSEWRSHVRDHHKLVEGRNDV